MPVGATEVSQNAYDADNEKTGNSGISREPTACVTEPPPKKKIKRTGRPFSKMKVIGNRAWFLKPEHMKDFTDNLVNIVGIIKQCPRKSNDNFYGIDWTGNDGMGLPEGLHPDWIRWEYKSSPRMKDDLQALIRAYRTRGASGAANITADGTSTPSVGFTTPARVPDAVRYGRAAAVRTSATISTLSVSSRGSRKSTGTISTKGSLARTKTTGLPAIHPRTPSPPITGVPQTVRDSSSDEEVQVRDSSSRRVTRAATADDETLLEDANGGVDKCDGSDLDEENHFGPPELLEGDVSSSEDATDLFRSINSIIDDLFRRSPVPDNLY